MLKKVFKSSAIIILGVALSMGCGKDEKADQGEKGESILYYTGCGIVKQAFMYELARSYEKETGVYVSISGGGATRGIRDAAARKVQIGGGCRHRLDYPEESDARAHHVAWDALVVIVHKDNPIENIQAKDLKQVLTGGIRTWEKIGGSGGEINVVARKGKISGVGRMTRELIFEDPEADYTKEARIYPSSGPLEESVERDQNALGITGISSARKRDVKIISVNNVEPTYENIASGTYPYFRPLYLYTHSNPDKATMDFISFATSSKGQQVIKDQKTVTLADGSGLIEKYDARMKAIGVTDWKGK